MPKAARERTVSFRARAPHSLRFREYPRPKASLDEQDLGFITETGTDVKKFVAVSGTSVLAARFAVLPCLNSAGPGVFSTSTPRCSDRSIGMKIKVVVHEAEEGGVWAEVPPFQAAPPKAKPWTS